MCLIDSTVTSKSCVRVTRLDSREEFCNMNRYPNTVSYYFLQKFQTECKPFHSFLTDAQTFRLSLSKSRLIVSQVCVMCFLNVSL